MTEQVNGTAMRRTRRQLLVAAGAGGAVVLGDVALAPTAYAESQTISSGPEETGLIVLAEGQGGSFQQSGTAPVGTNALSCVCHGRTDNNSALNVASDNPNASALMVTGEESGRGTVKVTHVGAADESDANASALSLSLATTGTAAQGIFLDAAGGTSGFLMQLRNGGQRKFLVLPDGRLHFAGADTAMPAAPLPASPDGYLRMVAPDGRAIRVPYYAE
jgi:hypothetical protein